MNLKKWIYLLEYGPNQGRPERQGQAGVNGVAPYRDDLALVKQSELIFFRPAGSSRLNALSGEFGGMHQVS